jgi:hypothetical protein
MPVCSARLQASSLITCTLELDYRYLVTFIHQTTYKVSRISKLGFEVNCRVTSGTLAQTPPRRECVTSGHNHGTGLSHVTTYSSYSLFAFDVDTQLAVQTIYVPNTTIFSTRADNLKYVFLTE